MRTPIKLLSFASLLAGCTAPAAELEWETTAEIVGGTATTDHSSVVSICRGPATYSCQGYCSGTLIAANLVLTARHCVDTGYPSYRPDGSLDCTQAMVQPNPSAKFWITTSPNITGARWRRGARVITTSGTTFCGNDVALIMLDTNVPSGEAAPATPLVDHALTDQPADRDTVTAVGYGVTSRNGTDIGVRRVRTGAPITCIPNDTVRPCASSGAFFHHDGVPEELTANEFLVGKAICNGDSGGPAFDTVTVASGAPVVVGIASRVGRTSQQCTFSIYQRVDLFRDLIVTTAREAAIAGQYPLPSWAADLD